MSWLRRKYNRATGSIGRFYSRLKRKEGKRFAEKTKRAIESGMVKMGNEARETREMAQLFFRLLEKKLNLDERKEPPTEEEVREAIEQLKDVGRVSFFAAFSILPGGAVSLIGLEILARKFGVRNFTFIPSSFRKNAEWHFPKGYQKEEDTTIELPGSTFSGQEPENDLPGEAKKSPSAGGPDENGSEFDPDAPSRNRGRNTSLLLCIAATLLPFMAWSQPVLNEMMSSNASVLRDQFDDYPDWLEIHNPGLDPVQLGDYWLSDDLMQLQKWNFPESTLPAGGFSVVFASGNDIPEQPVYWHTVVNMGDTWRYYLPGSDIGDQWKSQASAVSGWQTGKSGIGYSDGDDSTIVGTTTALYMHKAFEISGVSGLSDAVLLMDYDDGFVAYLNGTEIARSSNMGAAGSDVGFDQFASAGHEANMYNGAPPETFLLTDHIALFTEGTNVLAVEVHNVSATSSDLTSIPFLMLGFSDLRQDLQRGNPYVSMPDRYPHTNFRIKSAGEPVYLSDDQGNVVDMIDMIYLPTDYSYGRNPSAPDSFVYFALPTPAGPNDTDYSSQYFSDSVNFIIQGKDFDDFQKVVMESENPDDTIYFTTDGSEPDRSSQVYSSYLNITETTVVKARIFRAGNLPGPVRAKTFFVGQVHELPIVSVSTYPYNLWDYNYGIYVLGPNANPDNPHFGANFWQDWERPVYLEVYDANHELKLEQMAGTKIYGAWSRAHAQKSMSFFARSKYGDGSFSARLFEEKPIDKFEAFVMRNSGNDWCNSFFRDAFIGQLAGKMDLDYQAYAPHVFYLNGEYWGVLNMREKINEHFLADNHRVHSDEINLLTGNAQLIQGNRESYDELMNFVRSNSLESDENFEVVVNLMDVDNFMNYWVLNVYVDNKDWPGNNIKYWSTSSSGSLYRWIVYDTDFGLSIWDNSAYLYNTLIFSFGEGPDQTWANQDWATELIRSLLENEGFRIRFINAFADRMNTTFLPDRTVPVVDLFAGRIESEVTRHLEKFNNDNEAGWRTFSYWEGRVNQMKIFLEQRPFRMRGHIMSRFNISSTHDVGLTISGEGSIRLNSIIPDEYPFSGTYFEGVPIELEARPGPGYRFSHWTGDLESEEPIVTYHMEGPAEIQAVFEQGDEAEKRIVINEINYFSSPERNTEDWVELYNDSEFTVDLGGWVLKDGFTDDSFRIPQATLLHPGGYTLICRNIPDFKRFFPETGPLLGEMGYGLDRVEDGLGLYSPDGELHDYVIYTSESPWPAEPNGTGATLELIHPYLDNAIPESWKASAVQGTPCAENSVYDPSMVGADDPVVYDQSRFKLYPTVFHDRLYLRVSLDKDKNVKVRLFDITGKLLDVPVDRILHAGEQLIGIDPSTAGMNPGLVIVTIEAGGTTEVFKTFYH